MRTADVTYFESLALAGLKRFCSKVSWAPSCTKSSHSVHTGGKCSSVDFDHRLVYYWHSKGVTRWQSLQETTNVRDWRRYMEYSLMHEPGLSSCLAALTGPDSSKFHSCGVNFRSTPKPHFAGNFWWARCDHIAQLENPLGEKSGTVDQLSSRSITHKNANGDFLSAALRDTWIYSNTTRWRDDHTSIDTAAKRCWVCGEMWLDGNTLEPYSGIKNIHSSGVDHYKTAYPKESWAESFIVSQRHNCSAIGS